MPRKIVIEKAARTYLARQPRNRLVQIVRKIEQLAATGVSGELANNVRQLKGRNAYRLRVGDYRVVFEIDKATVTVIDVFSRGQGY